MIDRGDADDPSVIELDNPDDIPVIDLPKVCYNSKGVEDAARESKSVAVPRSGPWFYVGPRGFRGNLAMTVGSQ